MIYHNFDRGLISSQCEHSMLFSIQLPTRHVARLRQIARGDRTLFTPPQCAKSLRSGDAKPPLCGIKDLKDSEVTGPKFLHCKDLPLTRA
jgi:hypothetical protein